MSEDWSGYYDAVEARQPRIFVTRAIDALPAGRAIDLGCGDGAETRALLDAGWAVHAIDADAGGLERVRARAHPDDRLTTERSRFEDISQLPRADLVVACFSLSFCPPEAFDRLWAAITSALTPGGRFSGNVFGERDDWAGAPAMTFVGESRARAMFAGWDVEIWDEVDEDGEAASGPKHWHWFDVMAAAPA